MGCSLGTAGFGAQSQFCGSRGCCEHQNQRAPPFPQLQQICEHHCQGLVVEADTLPGFPVREARQRYLDRSKPALDSALEPPCVMSHGRGTWYCLVTQSILGALKPASKRRGLMHSYFCLSASWNVTTPHDIGKLLV